MKKCSGGVTEPTEGRPLCSCLAALQATGLVWPLRPRGAMLFALPVPSRLGFKENAKLLVERSSIAALHSHPAAALQCYSPLADKPFHHTLCEVPAGLSASLFPAPRLPSRCQPLSRLENALQQVMAATRAATAQGQQDLAQVP
ncbi:unnamed protein product [Boreogadus saida]